nr:TolC family protein [Burkholderia glumae]
MKHKLVFLAALLGLLAALGAAWFYSRREPPQSPVFEPAANPYARGVYANGIVESEQPAGANLNLYPDVSGAVTRVFVRDGDPVRAGEPLDALALADANYRQVVLRAFSQVADSLRALAGDAQAVDARADAMAASRTTLRLVQAGLDSGVGSGLQVLAADLQYRQARIAWLQAVAQRLQDTVAFYVALGGGWSDAY